MAVRSFVWQEIVELSWRAELPWLADEQLYWLRRVVECGLSLVSRDDVSPECALSRVGCAVLSFVAQNYV